MLAQVRVSWFFSFWRHALKVHGSPRACSRKAVPVVSVLTVPSSDVTPVTGVVICRLAGGVEVVVGGADVTRGFAAAAGRDCFDGDPVEGCWAVSGRLMTSGDELCGRKLELYDEGFGRLPKSVVPVGLTLDVVKGLDADRTPCPSDPVEC